MAIPIASKILRFEISILRGLHDFSGVALRRLGFEWELRRRGETKVGVWRKIIRKKSSAKRLIFVPGFGDTSLSWVGTVLLLYPVISKHYDEVILFDFPGFGGFLRHEKPIESMDQFCEITGDLFDSFTPHTIFGHSLGGWLTTHYAVECGKGSRPRIKTNHYPGPERLILVNASGVITDEVKGEAWKDWFKGFLEEGFGGIRPHLFKREPIWFRLLAHEFGGFLKRPEIKTFMESFERRHMLTDDLHHIRAEVLVFWGEDDSLVPIDLAKSAWDQTSATRVLLHGTGHTPQIERPVVMLGLLARVLASKPLPKRFLSRTRFGFRVESGAR